MFSSGTPDCRDPARGTDQALSSIEGDYFMSRLIRAELLVPKEMSFDAKEQYGKDIYSLLSRVFLCSNEDTVRPSGKRPLMDC